MGGRATPASDKEWSTTRPTATPARSDHLSQIADTQMLLSKNHGTSVKAVRRDIVLSVRRRLEHPLQIVQLGGRLFVSVAPNPAGKDWPITQPTATATTSDHRGSIEEAPPLVDPFMRATN